MNDAMVAWLAENYQWKLSLITMVSILGISYGFGLLAQLVPAFRSATRLNADTYRQKMEKPNYAANQRWNSKWGLFFIAVIFGLLIPFALTDKTQSLGTMLLDMVVILMVYDFFYYLTHRFLFHDNGFMGGPLVWMHAVHHRQHNPCRKDSSYIHPLEVFLGLGLYVATIMALSAILGLYHPATIVITWVVFTQINLHNHNRWEADRFPFKYVSYLSKMHHNHHAKFTGGNYATISLLYDWMFGSLDDGLGWGKNRTVPATAKAEKVEVAA